MRSQTHSPQAQHGEPVHINLLVLLETEWVLRRRYKLTKCEIPGTFSELLSAADLSFEDESSIDEYAALPEASHERAHLTQCIGLVA